MGGSFVFLGTGASAGVPLIGCHCRICKSSSPHNRRLRPCGWIQVAGKSFLIDVGPDFRQQALTHRIEKMDGLLLTHTHFDHIAGIDDLRIYSVRQKESIPCLLSQESFEALKLRYSYFFTKGTSETARLSFQIVGDLPGEALFQDVSFRYIHYRQGDMKITGYRIGDFAYVTDIREYDEAIFPFLEGVNHLVLSALREESSRFHLSLDEAVDFARKAKVPHTRLTHLSHYLDHEEANRKLPSDVQLGYDGLTIEFEV